MKRAFVLLLGVAFLFVIASDADACYKHGNSKWALHYAGTHDAKANTCAFQVTDCFTEVVVDAPSGPGRFDVYVLALDTNGIAGTRYGLCCTGDFYFYGWTKCSDLEIPTDPWPACGGGNAQTWGYEKPSGHVTLGILDVYVYAGVNLLYMCDDPRVGFAEWCDGSSPEPWCCKVTRAEHPGAFGCIGFGCGGYNPCGAIATEKTSWGAVKAIYQ